MQGGCGLVVHGAGGGQPRHWYAGGTSPMCSRVCPLMSGCGVCPRRESLDIMGSTCLCSRAGARAHVGDTDATPFPLCLLTETQLISLREMELREPARGAR